MVLRFDDRWVWDWWFADTKSEYHAFFLQAPRSLGDPERRHVNATIGHAVSTDLRSWRVLPDALGPSADGSWDDVSTWTGSTLHHEGRWYTFYTGTTWAGDKLVQRIGLATSDDLHAWHKHPDNPLMEVDPRWYESGDREAWRETAWRDPWVMRDPEGDGFHALITARAADGPPLERGVIGHARSHDLVHWEVRPPLSSPSGFGHLEVLQSEIVEGRAVLLFCCGTEDISPARRARFPDETSGTFLATGDSLLGPFDIDGARQIPVPGLYSGRIVRRRDGSWVILGFRVGTPSTPFLGELSDPIPLDELGVLPQLV